MGKRSVPPTPPGPAPQRRPGHLARSAGLERPLLDAIAAGDLDDHLTALADAIGARHHLLHTVRSAAALAELCVGDDVRINHTVSPRYLHGLHGRVIALDDQTATICLHRPVGRFTSGEIRCPPLALDRLPPAA
jgi:hypothetical protein